MYVYIFLIKQLFFLWIHIKNQLKIEMEKHNILILRTNIKI